MAAYAWTKVCGLPFPMEFLHWADYTGCSTSPWQPGCQEGLRWTSLVWKNPMEAWLSKGVMPAGSPLSPPQGPGSRVPCQLQFCFQNLVRERVPLQSYL